MRVGVLAARTAIGALFIGHGTQKLFGSFGGPGLEGTTEMMKAIKMEPARPNAIAAGVTETVGGAMLLAGLETPVACSMLIGTMITAIRKVNAANGPWMSKGGYEYNGVLITTLVMIAEEGPGVLSLDALRGKERKGTLWALTALGLGAAASTIVIELGRRASLEPEDLDEVVQIDEATVESELEEDDRLTLDLRQNTAMGADPLG